MTCMVPYGMHNVCIISWDHLYNDYSQVSLALYMDNSINVSILSSVVATYKHIFLNIILYQPPSLIIFVCITLPLLLATIYFQCIIITYIYLHFAWCNPHEVMIWTRKTWISFFPHCALAIWKHEILLLEQRRSTSLIKFWTKIGPLQDSVTWYGINYTGTQVTQWDFQNKGKSGWTGTSSFVLEVPLCNLRPSVINSVPCDRILQRAYWNYVRVSNKLVYFTHFFISIC